MAPSLIVNHKPKIINSFRVVFEYSYWWILPAILLSLAVAYFKYSKLSRLPDIAFGISLLIATLRFLVTFTLLLLLLNPAISFLHQIKEKPLLIVAQDNSASLIKNKDSLYYQNEYRASLAKAIQELEDKFEVVKLTFGSTVHKSAEIDYAEHRTDISAVIDYTNRNFVARQPEGMILLTDGIYNAGVNPRYKIPSFPVYTVSLGDTTQYPDVYIRAIETNKFCFLNTIFPLKAEVAALQQKGKEIKCVLRENDKVLQERIIQVDRDNFLDEVTFEVEAKHKGIVHYSVALETDFAERTRENNKAETWIQVIDNSARIGIFAAAPHPDISAIINAVNISGIYHCQEHQFNERFDTLNANLVILHNPDARNPGYHKLLQEVEKRKLALWYILTKKENILTYSHLNKHYSLNLNADLNEYATPGVNPAFPYFEFTDQEIAGYIAYPPLIVPFGELNTGAGRVLLTQTIKNTPTINGILAFYEQEGRRIAYLWGEGMWRWRLYSYQENGNHELFNTLVNKIVGYLATQKGNDRFVNDIKPVYEETDETILNVELYNDSYELVNTPDVELELKHGDKKFDYQLNRNGEKYRIHLGNLPAGEYAYRLSTNLKGETFEKNGLFYVRSHNPELNDLVANRQLLKEIAENSGAQLFIPHEMDKLVQLLKDNDKLKPVYKSEIEFLDLSRMKILGLILLVLLCIEWFLLKFFAD